MAASTGRAADQPRGRPIEFSDPKSSEITTNLNQLTGRRGGLRDLEDDLTKSFQQTFSSGGSLDGVVVPPVRSGPGPGQNKKVKEVLERKKNWAFRNPEDLTSGPTAEELFNLPEYGADGKEKKPRSSVESYFERLDHDRQGALGKRDREGAGDKPFAAIREAVNLQDDAESKNEVLREIKDSDRSMLRFFDSRPGGSMPVPESPRSTWSDIFGLGETRSIDQLDAQKLYEKANMNQFKQLLGSSPLPSMATEGPSFVNPINESRPVVPIGGLDTLPAQSRPSSFGGNAGRIGSPSSPFGLPDAAMKAADPWAAPPMSPKVELPKVTPGPSILDFSRKF